jgi:hypothetical protein
MDIYFFVAAATDKLLKFLFKIFATSDILKAVLFFKSAANNSIECNSERFF